MIIRFLTNTLIVITCDIIDCTPITFPEYGTTIITCNIIVKDRVFYSTVSTIPINSGTIISNIVIYECGIVNLAVIGTVGPINGTTITRSIVNKSTVVYDRIRTTGK